MTKLTHIGEDGAARMVDVAAKATTERSAKVSAQIAMLPETLRLVVDGAHKKGEVLGVARIAGIQAAKQCSQLIPLCHGIMLSKVDLDFEIDPALSLIRIACTAKCSGQTGVEMEAFTGATVAALTIYDMCKAVDRGMVIGEIKLVEKTGGKSGHWRLDV